MRAPLLGDVVAGLVRSPDLVARGLALRDATAWARSEFLGVACRTGVAEAVGGWASVGEVAARSAVTDLELLEALLELGVALREVKRRGGRYRASGLRLRAAIGRSDDVRALYEGLVVYEGAVYGGLADHLRGAAPGPYLDGVGDVIARVSRLAEPVVAAGVRAVVAEVQPSTVVDVGCGSGAHLISALLAAPSATGVGIDADAGAVDVASAALAASPVADRAQVRHVALDAAAAGGLDERFDLALLLNNIYYWPPEARDDAVRQVASLAPGGTVVVASAVPNRVAYNRHLDLVLRATAGSWRLPTASELAGLLSAAGLRQVRTVEPVPGGGLVVAVGTAAP